MTTISYRYCHFPREIVQRAVWLYVRFTLSFRDVEELLAERGIGVSYACGTLDPRHTRFGTSMRCSS